MKLYFATNNAHKREELERILAPHAIVMPSDEGIDFDPEETAPDFFGNALLKARALYLLVGCPVVADDSGICVDALGGAPGIRSARYGSENGVKLDSSGRNRLLLSEMEGKTERSCRFVCNMVLYLGPDRFISVQETLEGRLVTEARGEGGFGYDPLVFLPEFGCTVAELPPEDKDRCSHRGKAGKRLAALLTGLPCSQG
jgi:non-canonical purine NTP pyrophosphatase, rdgB/HAM1 family